jgi:hypothetical protein
MDLFFCIFFAITAIISTHVAVYFDIGAFAMPHNFTAMFVSILFNRSYHLLVYYYYYFKYDHYCEMLPFILKVHYNKISYDNS